MGVAYKGKTFHPLDFQAVRQALLDLLAETVDLDPQGVQAVAEALGEPLADADAVLAPVVVEEQLALLGGKAVEAAAKAVEAGLLHLLLHHRVAAFELAALDRLHLLEMV